MRIVPHAKCKNVFENLPSGLIDKSQKIILKRGDFLYQKGDPANGIFYIKDGLIALVNISPSGHESLLRVFTNNFFIGYRSFIASDEHHASSQALTDCVVYRLSINSLDSLKINYPDVLMHISQMLARDLRIAEERFNDLTGKRVLSRIIDALIFLKQRKGDYPWTRREIGEFCGATTETVTRSFKKLENEGLIQKEGREVIVKDMEKLLAYKLEIDLEE